MRLTYNDAGCYADGANGHDHIRAKLAAMMRELSLNHRIGVSTRGDCAAIAIELNQPMSDDASEENDAIEFANQYLCDDTARFEMRDGDLMLLPICGACGDEIEDEGGDRCPEHREPAGEGEES